MLKTCIGYHLNCNPTVFHACTSYISGVHAWIKGAPLFKGLRYNHQLQFILTQKKDYGAKLTILSKIKFKYLIEFFIFKVFMDSKFISKLMRFSNKQLPIEPQPLSELVQQANHPCLHKLLKLPLSFSNDQSHY